MNRHIALLCVLSLPLFSGDAADLLLRLPIDVDGDGKATPEDTFVLGKFFEMGGTPSDLIYEINRDRETGAEYLDLSRFFSQFTVLGDEGESSDRPEEGGITLQQDQDVPFLTRDFFNNVQVRYFPASGNPPFQESSECFGTPACWYHPAFNDAGWWVDAQPVGYPTNEHGYHWSPPAGQYTTLYARVHFQLTQADLDELQNDRYAKWWFVVDFDDGFVVWLNGQHPAVDDWWNLVPQATHRTLRWDQVATQSHEYRNDPPIYMSDPHNFLVVGDNVLAIEVHNQSAASSDMGFYVDFLATQRGPYVTRVTRTTADVVWYTQHAVIGEVHYGTSPDNLNQSVVEMQATTEHIVTLTGLGATPAYTRYCYEVIAGNTDWPLGSFVAGGKYASTPFSFIVYGDSGADGNAYNGQPGQNQIDIRDLLEDFFDPQTPIGAEYGTPDFLLHTADLVCDYPYKNWFDRQFFGFYDTTLLQAPIYTSIGNHEAQRDGKANYLEAMVMPEGEAAGGEKYYSFNWHNVHIVCLDTTQDNGASVGVWDPQSQQAAWLEADLSANANHQTWIVVVFHHPPYDNLPHDDPANVWQLRQLFDVFRERHVDVVFCGHSHFYERTHPLTTKGAGVNPGDIFDPAFDDDYAPGPLGTIYVTTGGGGRPLRGPTAEPWVPYALQDFHIVRVRVQGLQLNMKVIDEDGNDLPHLEVTLAKPGYKFNRGDVNQDVRHDIGDAIEVLGYLFGSSFGNACRDSYDANDDGALNVADAVYMLSYLQSGGPPPPAPFRGPPYPYPPDGCGTDPTPDQLGCEKFAPAEVPNDWDSGWIP